MSLDVVILATGQGTRMKSGLPKALHHLGGQPLIFYSVQQAAAVSEQPPVVVIRHGSDAVREVVGNAARYVSQVEKPGTGHAVAQTRKMLEGQSQHVVVICSDMPLLRGSTLQALCKAQQAHDGPFSILTARGTDTPLGVYCFDADWLWDHLDHIPLNSKGECNLTDLVTIAVAEGGVVNALPMDDPDEAIRIHTRVHLAEAEVVLRQRVNQELMLSGVTITDPNTTYIHPTAKIGQDTVILPNTHVRGNTVIGQECVIGPNSIIQDSVIGDRCEIVASVVEYATLENDVDVGPFGHLRKGAYLESDVHVGNFGEVKNSRLRRGAKMGHFSYVGDADIGEETNIGAGTVTCNYDGVRKHKTVTGKKVFIGSGSMLVAPVTLGDGAISGAGAVVTRDVPPDTLVVGVPAHPRPSKVDQSEED